MFRFEHPDHLYALLLLPLLVLIFWSMWRWRQRRLRRLGDPDTIARMMPGFSKAKRVLKFSLLLLGLGLLIIGWANPQWGTKRQRVTPKALDIFFALDISQSMLVEDLPPNRLERAKRFCEELITELRGNRIGLILFAGTADLHMPLTMDYRASNLFLRSASPRMASLQGTSVSEAIERAQDAFPEESERHKVLVIISDGESHDEQSIQRAEQAREKGMLIFTVGVGTQNGGFVPETISGRTLFKKDKQGNPIRSSLQEALLQEVAETGGGDYFYLRESESLLSSIRDRINQLEKKELEQRVFEEHESYFQYFIGLALLILILEFFLSERKAGWLPGREIFEK